MVRTKKHFRPPSSSSSSSESSEGEDEDYNMHAAMMSRGRGKQLGNFGGGKQLSMASRPGGGKQLSMAWVVFCIIEVNDDIDGLFFEYILDVQCEYHVSQHLLFSCINFIHTISVL